MSLVQDADSLFADKRYGLGRKLPFQCDVIHRFQKPASKVSVDLHGTANDPIGPRIPMVEDGCTPLRHLRNLRALSKAAEPDKRVTHHKTIDGRYTRSSMRTPERARPST